MTGLNIYRTAKPVTSWLQGRIYPMRQEDAYFWQRRDEQKPRCYGFGRK